MNGQPTSSLLALNGATVKLNQCGATNTIVPLGLPYKYPLIASEDTFPYYFYALTIGIVTDAVIDEHIKR